jgi:hypothetical protein
MDTREPPTIVPWFSRRHYPDVLATMADAALLPQSHEAWRRGFEERLRALRRGNVETLVVRIDPRAFRIWCEAEELPCNAEARLEFADLLAQMALRETVPGAAEAETAAPQGAPSPVSDALRARIPGWPVLDEVAT